MITKREILRQLLSGEPVTISDLKASLMRPFCFFVIFADYVQTGMYGNSKRITFDEFQEEKKCCNYPIILQMEDYQSDPIE